jgi:hypothetical protein
MEFSGVALPEGGTVEHNRVGVILGSLNDVMQHLDALYADRQVTQVEAQFAEEELRRLNSLVEVSSVELDALSREVDELTLERERFDRKPPDQSQYDNIRSLEESNQGLRLNIAAKEELLEEILKEANRVHAEVEERRRTEKLLDKPLGSPERQEISTSVEHLGDSLLDCVADDGGSCGIVRYLRTLLGITQDQEAKIHRLVDAESRLLSTNEEIEKNEALIVNLRRELELSDVDVPCAPMTHRTNRLIKMRQRCARGGGKSKELLALRPSGSSTLADASLVINASGLIETPRAGIPAPTLSEQWADEVVSARLPIPCGLLKRLVEHLGMQPRKLAQEMGLSTFSVRIEDKSTIIECSGRREPLRGFEARVLQAVEAISTQLKNGEGLMTYGDPYHRLGQEALTEKISTLLVSASDTSQQRELSTQRTHPQVRFKGEGE